MIQDRRVGKYRRGNPNPYIKEEQTTQWPKEKVRKDKQRSAKHTYKTKDRVTRTPLKTGVNSGVAEGLVEITIMDTIGQMLQNKSTKRS